MTSSDGVLKIPLQINGGTQVPEQLKDRELFVDTATGLLYYGKGANDSGGPATMIGIRGKVGNVELYNLNGNSAKIGGLSITQNGDGYLFQPSDSLKHKIQFSGVRLGSLVLTTANYGSSLPNSGVEGQIFFLIP